MVWLRSQLKVKNDVEAVSVWDALVSWRSDSKNTPDAFRKWLQENPFSSLQQTPQNVYFDDIQFSYYVPSVTKFAFRLSEANGSYITTVCFDNQIDDCNLTLEFDVKDEIGYTFSKPKVFSYLQPLLCEEKYSSKAFVDGNYSKVSEIFIDNHFDLPVIYISATPANNYLVDPDELAQQLYGIAYVYKEPNFSFAQQLKFYCKYKNPHNGAIGVFCNNNRIYIPAEKIESFFFLKRISQLTLLLHTNDSLSWYGMTRPFYQKATDDLKSQISDITEQIKKSEETKQQKEKELSVTKKTLDQKNLLILQLQRQLAAEINDKNAIETEYDKLKKEHENYLDSFDSELQDKDLEIENLRKENEKLKVFENSFKKSSGSNDITLNIKCTEKELYPGEFADFFKGLIFRIASGYNKYNGGTSDKDAKGFIRLYNFLQSICDNNKEFFYKNTESYRMYNKLEISCPDNESTGIRTLEDVGFVRDNAFNGHFKLFFHGDKRYSVTTPASWSDKRSCRNYISEALHCFLNPKDITL